MDEHYTLDTPDDVLAANPVAAALVAALRDNHEEQTPKRVLVEPFRELIAELRGRGRSWDTITNILNEHGVPISRAQLARLFTPRSGRTRGLGARPTAETATPTERPSLGRLAVVGGGPTPAAAPARPATHGPKGYDL